MRIFYAFLLLLSPSTVLAQTGFSIKPGFVVKQAPTLPQAPAVKGCDCIFGQRCTCGQSCNCTYTPLQAKANGWTYREDGTACHASGYCWTPDRGVYWPQPQSLLAQTEPAVNYWYHYPARPVYYGGFGGGFAGNCPPSG